MLELGEASMVGNAASAAAWFRKALVLDDCLQRARYLLGDMMEKLGRSDEAESLWLEAIRRDPLLSPPVISLGFRRINQQRYEEAIELMKRGVQLQPHYGRADAHLFLARAYEAAGRIDEAKMVCQEVLKMEPMYPSYERPMDEAREKLRLLGDVRTMEG